MLISEVINPEVQTFQAFADQIKTQYGLQQFDVWLDQDGDIRLGMMVVPDKDRRTGLGTGAMLALTRFADKYGKRILLSPAAREDMIGTTSKNRLVQFYKKFGFALNKGKKKDYRISDSMYRDPGIA